MKTKISIFALVIVSIFCLFAASGSTGAEGNKKLVIAYSGNIEGYLEPCG